MGFFKMAGTAFTNLFRKPATLMYPVRPAKRFPNSRGTLTIEFEKCILCGICQKKCPSYAIEVDKTENTWKIDRIRCISCGSCTDWCPKKCLHLDNPYTAPVTPQFKDPTREQHTGA